jgi:uncharacterized protein DUF4154
VPQLFPRGVVSPEVEVRRVRRAAVLLAVTAAISAPQSAQQSDSQQYEAKAKFLTVVPGFVEWPAETFKTSTSPLQICVFGDFRFGTSLAELARTETVGGHRMEVKWVRKEVRKIIETQDPVSAD